MLNKKILAILCLTLHLTVSLKSLSFCHLKQQECKGFYDEKHNYQTKCELIKCNGAFKYECGSTNICSNSITKCKKYSEMMIFFSVIIDQHSNKINNIKLFNKQIKDCKNKTYKFKSNDYCQNGQKCKTIIYSSFTKISKPIDCQCPTGQSFKCGKYCTTSSIACDYLKSNKENTAKVATLSIKDCGNHNSTYFKSYLNIW